jgi:hypothetical protein
MRKLAEHDLIVKAHGHSSYHQLELQKNSVCGCFYADGLNRNEGK